MQIEIKDVEEANFILNALDAYVKANGIPVAGRAMVLVAKIQEAAKSFKPEEPES